MSKNTIKIADNQANTKKKVRIPAGIDANQPASAPKSDAPFFEIVPPPDMESQEPSLEGCRNDSLSIKDVGGGKLYFWSERKGKTIKKEDVTNFVILPLYFLRHNSNPKRIFEMINIYGERATVCIESKKMTSSDSFRAELEGKGNFVAKFDRTQHDALKELIFYQNDAAQEIDTLGWQPNERIYAMSNGVFDGSKFYKIDSFGIAHTPAGKFYLPAFSSVNKNGAAEYANERKFLFEPGKIKLTEWSNLINLVYGNNGKVGIAYVIACLFRDLIYQSLDVFPMLFLFAPPQSGKSTYRDSFLSLFGEPQTAISLGSASSPKGFNRKLAQFKNGLIVFEEYKNRLKDSLIEMLKSMYDGIGYERAQMTNDNKTHTTPVLSGCMVVGQEIPTKENALFTRVLMLEFSRQKWSKEEKINLDNLRKAESEGLGTVLFQILQHREQIEKHFKSTYNQVFSELRRAQPIVSDRHAKNAAAILAPFKIIAERENIAFTYQELFDFVLSRLEDQDEMMTRNNEVNQFWETFHALRSMGDGVSNDFHFKKENDELWLRFDLVYAKYNKFHREQGLNALDKESLRKYLKQQPYFILTKGEKDTKTVRFSSGPKRAYGFKADAYPIKFEENDE